MGDDLGDRMKSYEAQETGRRFLPLLPIVARIDGRSFSSFTKDMKRPFDDRMSKAMIETTRWLAKETNSSCGYTQSDEITLCWRDSSQLFFDGKVQKIVSVLSGMATVYFNALLKEYFPPEYYGRFPHFDCRVFAMPNTTEVANCYLWRILDAGKNSISMAARCYFSHNKLHGKNGSEMQEMLFQKGINWNDYPPHFKRGTLLQKRTTKKQFSKEELEQLPLEHEALKNKDLIIERSEYVFLDIPFFSKVTNREGVIFNGEDGLTPS